MPAETIGLHFSEPLWLWALLALLLFWWWPRGKHALDDQERLERYADRHLLPHLLLGGLLKGKRRRRLSLWSLLWVLGVVAMAGPRWDYTDVRVYQPGTDLVILLDLSRSMQISDVKPSRLARARQEVKDLLDRNPGLRVGMIAFASVAHVIAPITEDDETLRHLLPSLSTDLVRWQGSRASSALEQARQLLSGQPHDSAHALLLISDGDFAETGLEQQLKILRGSGIRLYVLGIGTTAGGRVPAPRDGWVRGEDGEPIVSRLDEERLKALAEAGGGIYRRADFRDDDTRALLQQVVGAGQSPAEQETTQRIWHERFYLPVSLMLVLLLIWFRRRRDVWN